MSPRTASLTTLILAFAWVSTSLAQDEQTSYGYVRTLEGSATLISADTGTAHAAKLNHPVLTGDRLMVDPGSRIELVLSDFNILRVEGDTELVFSRLAFSADGSSRVTALRLERGGMQIVVTEYALGDELPSLVLPNATVFLHEPGSYRVSTHAGLSRMTVRSGYLEALTEWGSAIARTEEEIEVDGMGWPAVAVLEAGPLDELELWGDDLMAAADLGDGSAVDPALAYSSDALDDAGDWLEIDGESTWSPHVEESWRPYSRGSWASTPSGLSWVGYERWGWVTGHYGSWRLNDRYGWLWYPGAAYAPAWVYWYWGPNYVGWVPTGYYHGYYGNPLALTLGFQGYAGGYWGHYADWTFCPQTYFGYPHGNSYFYGGRQMPGRTGRTAVPRGVITTDTRGLEAIDWRDGTRVAEVLNRQGRAAGPSRSTDITSFIAREPDLRPEVRTAVKSGTRWGGSIRIGSARVTPDAGARTIAARSTVGFSTRSTGSGAAPSRVSTPEDQGWRSRGSGRRLYTMERPESRERLGTLTTPDRFSRVRDAWRVSAPERTERLGVRLGGYPEAHDSSRHTLRTSRGNPYSTPPVRRVIEGVTSSRSAAGGERAGTMTRPGRISSRQGSRGWGSALRGSAARRSTGSRPSGSGRTSVGRSSSAGRSSGSNPRSQGSRASASRSRSRNSGSRG